MAGVGSVQSGRGHLRWDRLRLHFRPPFLEPCACSRPIWFQSHSNWIRALMKQTLHMVVRFSPAESVMQVMTFQSHNQYPQLKESDAINDITAKTCQSETSTTNLNENFKTCCLFSIGEILFPIDSWEARFFFFPTFPHNIIQVRSVLPQLESSSPCHHRSWLWMSPQET